MLRVVGVGGGPVASKVPTMSDKRKRISTPVTTPAIEAAPAVVEAAPLATPDAPAPAMAESTGPAVPLPVAGANPRRASAGYTFAPYSARGSAGGVHPKRGTTPVAAKAGSWVATVAILASAPGGVPLAVLDAMHRTGGMGDSPRGILAWLAQGMGWGVATTAEGGIYLHDGTGPDGKGRGLTEGRPVAHPGTLSPAKVREWYAAAKLAAPAYLAA